MDYLGNVANVNFRGYKNETVKREEINLEMSKINLGSEKILEKCIYCSNVIFNSEMKCHVPDAKRDKGWSISNLFGSVNEKKSYSHVCCAFNCPDKKYNYHVLEI